MEHQASDWEGGPIFYFDRLKSLKTEKLLESMKGVGGSSQVPPSQGSRVFPHLQAVSSLRFLLKGRIELDSDVSRLWIERKRQFRESFLKRHSPLGPDTIDHGFRIAPPGGSLKSLKLFGFRPEITVSGSFPGCRERSNLSGTDLGGPVCSTGSGKKGQDQQSPIDLSHELSSPLLLRVEL